MGVAGKVIRGFGAAIGVAACVLGGTGPAGAQPGPDGHMYAAFAISARQPDNSFRIGATWNYPFQADADRSALRECGASCTIALRYRDVCGSIAWRGARYAGGIGNTREEAERNAIGAVGPPFPSSISADITAPARISGTHCNGQR